MHTRRVGVGCAVVKRLLFAVGGFDGVNRLSTVECYDPEKDEWRMVASMNTVRSGAGMSVLLGVCVHLCVCVCVCVCVCIHICVNTCMCVCL